MQTHPLYGEVHALEQGHRWGRKQTLHCSANNTDIHGFLAPCLTSYCVGSSSKHAWQSYYRWFYTDIGQHTQFIPCVSEHLFCNDDIKCNINPKTGRSLHGSDVRRGVCWFCVAIWGLSQSIPHLPPASVPLWNTAASSELARQLAHTHILTFTFSLWNAHTLKITVLPVFFCSSSWLDLAVSALSF